jgi:outer membrane PBP1 activator LpoA protein
MPFHGSNFSRLASSASLVMLLAALVLAACASTASSTDRHVVFESYRFT